MLSRITTHESRITLRLLLAPGGELCLGLEPFLLQHAGKPEVHGGESEKEQRQPAHGLRRQESPALDRDVEPEEGVDDACQVEQQDPLLEPLVYQEPRDS